MPKLLFVAGFFQNGIGDTLWKFHVDFCLLGFRHDQRALVFRCDYSQNRRFYFVGWIMFVVRWINILLEYGFV